ncbi:MAG: substrate-binding domain-containing protein [Actinomycetota bacterium]|nr:substrate-binding domain-containing protein [Actinomycetota bacterium]
MVIVMTVSMLTVFSLAGCSGGAIEEAEISADGTPAAEEPAAEEPTVEEAKDITIAVVPKALDNPIFTDTAVAVEEIGKELGIKTEYVGPTSSDAAEQVLVIEGLIEKGVDGILISPNDPDALSGVISKAIEKGIKIGCFDSDAPESERLFYIGTDNYELGKVCAEYLIEVSDGEAPNTAVMTGVIGAWNHEERIRGFKETIEDYDIEVASVQACDDNIEKSVEILNTYTPAHPELDAWFVTGGWPFFVPVDALPEIQKFREKGGYFVIIDTFYPQLAFMQQDPPYADVMVGQDFYAMGEIGVKTLYELAINGEDELEDEIIITPMEICTKENVGELETNKTPWSF